MKNILILMVIGAVAVGVFLWRKDSSVAGDHKSTKYRIEGQLVGLDEATRYFGNEARGDFNGDGKEDIAFLLTRTPGGSGTFYYVAAALGADNGFVGTNAVFLGDRIAPQTTEFRDGNIIVNYADRKPGEPMTASPSVGTSKRLKVQGGQLIEVTN